jgi:hypothetical protein
VAFSKGQSGNPGGRKRAIGLSRAVRKSEGLKTWAMLLDIRDEKIREQKIEWEDGEPVTIDVVPSIKERREACKLILAYCWGQPTQKIDFDSEDGKVFAFAVLIHPEAEGMLNGEQRKVRTPVRPDGISFDFIS